MPLPRLRYYAIIMLPPDFDALSPFSLLILPPDAPASPLMLPAFADDAFRFSLISLITLFMSRYAMLCASPSVAYLRFLSRCLFSFRFFDIFADDACRHVCAEMLHGV